MEKLELGLVSLLQLTWIALILPLLVSIFPIPGLGYVRRALLGITRRGKILQSNSKLTVPQRYFAHFYVMATCWTTILLAAMLYYASNILIEQDLFSTITGGSHVHKSVSMREHVYNVWLSVFLLLLMEVQVLRRFYESYYVFNYSPSARLHIIGYLGGLLYYVAAPLSLCCTFVPEAYDFVKKVLVAVEGSDRVSRPEFNIWIFVTQFFRLRWNAWMGAVIFFWGWVHQYRTHKILGSLRKKPKKQGEYVIPYGDWFEYVSSPHYLEIVIYGGMLVASGGADLSVWLLFVAVVGNLVLAAIDTQKWYLNKFDNYPPNRYAIFPFVY